MMHQILSVVYLVLFCLFLLAGIVMVPFTLPGTWMIALGAVLFSLVRDYKASSDWVVIAIVVGLALLGEIVELATSAFGAKKEHVPTGAVVCSLIGGLVGAIIGVPVFLIGALLGLLIGTFLGAFLYSLVKKGNVAEALSQALVILASRVVAIFAKTSVAVCMAVYLLFKVF